MDGHIGPRDGDILMQNAASVFYKGARVRLAVLLFIFLLISFGEPFWVGRNGICWRTIGPVEVPWGEVGHLDTPEGGTRWVSLSII